MESDTNCQELGTVPLGKSCAWSGSLAFLHVVELLLLLLIAGRRAADDDGVRLVPDAARHRLLGVAEAVVVGAPLLHLLSGCANRPWSDDPKN